jgi:hypothetical protein
LRPSVANAITLRKVLRHDLGAAGSGLTLEGLTRELADQSAAVSKGDLARPEAMLLDQAHTLEALFGHLTRLAYGHLDNADMFGRLLRLAFRAQSQARATVETLAAMRNPSVVIAKQANVSSGPQQVNNGIALPIPSRARENDIRPTELLEKQRGSELLDGGTKSTTNVSDPAVEAVGAVDRAKDGRGQG